MKKEPELFARLLHSLVCGVDDRKEIKRRIDRFMELLEEKRALHLLNRIARRFEELWNAEERIVEAVVTVRRASIIDVKRTQNSLEKSLNKKIALVINEDPRLIGGACIRVGDFQFDASLRSRLNQLKEVMITQ